MWSLIIIVAMVFCAAATGGIFKPGDWYEGLEKPSWTPPNWAFPVVWSILYIMIIAAGWIVWQRAGLGPVMVLWGLQLVLNGLWSALFFGARRMDIALVDVAALWLSIALFILLAWPISVTAVLLFVPYLVWVSAAAALNYSVFRLNPEARAS